VLNKLYTERGKKLPPQPWNIYPRPQMRRDSFACLNGEWDFTVTDGAEPKAFDRKITLPFAPESLLSGIGETFDESSVLWYRKEFETTDLCDGKRLLLHFGAVDQISCVYLNGIMLGKHEGGYDHFSFDVTGLVKETNTLIVKVTDHLSDFVFPYGKQCRKRGGMWYTPVSGIWQTVWLEEVPERYIRSLRIETGTDYVSISVDGVSDGVVTVKGVEGSFPLSDSKALIRIEEPHLWSPEDPYLYDFTVTVGQDKVDSYFALRSLEIKEINGISRLCLNGKPYFFHGLLDQGYWSDGLLTPASPECYADDILAMKSLGFNMLRKHIKTEPEQFYYDCDRLGMVVFQDMVNNGKYSFLRDTALPTVGFIRRSDDKLHKDAETRHRFVEGMLRTVEQLYNHPCICCWTIFNEGWGQFCGTEMYRKLKKLDGSRFIDTASGWFGGCETDLDSRHVYFRRLKLKSGEKPLFLSEFGGYSFKPEGHVFNEDQTYGYGKFKDRKSFVKAFCELYENEVLPLVKDGLSAAVYTQVSDVEDETNGLFSFDRYVLKVKPEEFLDISRRITSDNGLSTNPD